MGHTRCAEHPDVFVWILLLLKLDWQIPCRMQGWTPTRTEDRERTDPLCWSTRYRPFVTENDWRSWNWNYWYPKNLCRRNICCYVWMGSSYFKIQNCWIIILWTIISLHPFCMVWHNHYSSWQVISSKKRRTFHTKSSKEIKKYCNAFDNVSFHLCYLPFWNYLPYILLF